MIAGTVFAVVGVIVAGLAAIFMPEGRLEHFGRWLTDPATAFALAPARSAGCRRGRSEALPPCCSVNAAQGYGHAPTCPSRLPGERAFVSINIGPNRAQRRAFESRRRRSRVALARVKQMR